MRISILSRRVVATLTQVLFPKRAFSDHRFLVPDRGYLEISGKDLTKFLQGVCTNDVHKLKKNGDCIAAAFLTPKGRVLADALLYYCQDASEKVKIVIETHRSAIAPLTDYLSNYKLRSKVKMNHSINYRTVLTNSSSTDSLIPGDQMNKEKAKDRAILSVRDPRIFSLGIRSLYNDEIIPDVCHAIDGEMFHNSSVPLSANDYNRIRLLNGLMEGPEIVNRIPLECNLDLLNYIDFTKGCYVGQELTARTKFKGLVRKRILPFLRSSLHPQFTTDKVSFCQVDNRVIRKESSSVVELANRSSTPEGEIGTICLPKMEDDVDGFDLHVGDIVGISMDGDICCALVRLENVLPRTVGDVLPEFGVKFTANSNDAASGNSNDATPIDIIMTPVFPIRPPYWVDSDPITNHRLDTHAD